LFINVLETGSAEPAEQNKRKKSKFSCDISTIDLNIYFVVAVAAAKQLPGSGMARSGIAAGGLIIHND